MINSVETVINSKPFGTLFRELLSDEYAERGQPDDPQRQSRDPAFSEMQSATVSLALDEHRIRRESLESVVAKEKSKERTNLPSEISQPQPSSAKLTADDTLKTLIGTMDSAMSAGKRTLRQRLEEAMSQSSRRQRNNNNINNNNSIAKDTNEYPDGQLTYRADVPTSDLKRLRHRQRMVREL